jgi:hypothetical protein
MKPMFASIAAASALLGGCARQVAAPVVPVRAPVEAAAKPAPMPPPAPHHAVGPCRQVRDGNAIARLQGAAEELIARLGKDPTYGGGRFEHFPCYRLVLAFTDDRPRPSVVEAADPELRSYLAFSRASISQLDFEQARREIFAAVAATRVRAMIAVSSFPPLLEIGVRTGSEARIVRSVIPIRYRAITKVIPGGYAERVPE